jgi:hypothetical protein
VRTPIPIGVALRVTRVGLANGNPDTPALMLLAASSLRSPGTMTANLWGAILDAKDTPVQYLIAIPFSSKDAASSVVRSLFPNGEVMRNNKAGLWYATYRIVPTRSKELEKVRKAAFTGKAIAITDNDIAAGITRQLVLDRYDDPTTVSLRMFFELPHILAKLKEI